jgi:hypothetical protein
MNTIWENTISIFRDDYKTKSDYYKAYQECNQHYEYKAHVVNGWKFFQFENDYQTWKNQT